MVHFALYIPNLIRSMKPYQGSKWSTFHHSKHRLKAILYPHHTMFQESLLGMLILNFANTGNQVSLNSESLNHYLCCYGISGCPISHYSDLLPYLFPAYHLIISLLCRLTHPQLVQECSALQSDTHRLVRTLNQASQNFHTHTGVHEHTSRV